MSKTSCKPGCKKGFFRAGLCFPKKSQAQRIEEDQEGQGNELVGEAEPKAKDNEGQSQEACFGMCYHV